jgi:hypothetical protein
MYGLGPAQFDTLAQVLKDCRTKDVFYVPGEHGWRRGRAEPSEAPDNWRAYSSPCPERDKG